MKSIAWNKEGQKVWTGIFVERTAPNAFTFKDVVPEQFTYEASTLVCVEYDIEVHRAEGAFILERCRTLASPTDGFLQVAVNGTVRCE